MTWLDHHHQHWMDRLNQHSIKRENMLQAWQGRTKMKIKTTSKEFLPQRLEPLKRNALFSVYKAKQGTKLMILNIPAHRQVITICTQSILDDERHPKFPLKRYDNYGQFLLTFERAPSTRKCANINNNNIDQANHGKDNERTKGKKDEESCPVQKI